MDMVRTGEIDKNQPPLTPQQQLQGAWGFLSVPMGLTLSPAHWVAQQERIQATHKVEHPLSREYMSQEGYIKENGVANPPKHHQLVSHPPLKDTVLQQIRQTTPSLLPKDTVFQGQKVQFHHGQDSEQKKHSLNSLKNT